MIPIHTILYPTDFSRQSEPAFQLAASVARDHNARLVVLHVVPPPGAPYGETMTGLAAAAARKQAEESLHKFQLDNVKVEHRLEEGDPIREILRVARELPCDLIVMGTHGWTGLNRLLMGSVAEQIVRKSACPVLTIRTPLPESPDKTRGAARSPSAVQT
jgi:nucleotide-binding universal stress UspA family protein